MLNKVLLIGYAGADSEMKFTAVGLDGLTFGRHFHSGIGLNPLTEPVAYIKQPCLPYAHRQKWPASVPASMC